MKLKRRFLIPLAVAVTAFAGLASYCDRPVTPPPIGGDTLGAQCAASPMNECVKGTVDFNPIEGGCWLIKGENGKWYQPIGGLDEKFKRDGLRVYMVFRPNDGVAGFCPGQFVNVVSLTELPGGAITPVTPIPPLSP